jgi:hypothetical protein
MDTTSFLLTGESENLNLDPNETGSYTVDLKFAEAYLLVIPPARSS